MPYTLAMFFVWGLTMTLVGLAVGWLLRSVRRPGTRRSTAELERLRARVAELDGIERERDRLRMELADVRGSSAGALGFSPPPTDLDAATAILGHEVVLDDLTEVHGIGPKIVELCAGIGVTTWRQLAATEPSMLATMLEDGGSQFKSHDPTSWPDQARLLADGRWADFRALVAELGR